MTWPRILPLKLWHRVNLTLSLALIVLAFENAFHEIKQGNIKANIKKTTVRAGYIVILVFLP